MILRPVRLALLFLLAGCASDSPALYTLPPRPGPVRAGAAHVIVVRGVGVPRYLERQEIIRTAGQDQLIVSSNDWWGEPIAAMLRRVLVDDISQRLPASDVLAGEGSFNARADLEVELAVQRFDRDDAQVMLAGYVATEGKGRMRTLDRLRINVPVAGSSTHQQVEAMGVALAQVADVVAQRLVP